MSPRKTYRLAGPRHSAIVTETVPEDCASRWVEDPERLFAGDPEWPPGSPARTTRVSTDVGDLFIKQQRRALGRALLDAMVRRPAPAARAFAIGLRLAEKGVDATRPLALIRRRRPGETFLVLENIDAPDLHVYLVEGLSALPNEAERRSFKSKLLPELARCVADLHGAGVRQRDLKAPNVLVVSESGASPRPVLVDLEGMERCDTGPSRSQRERDLSRLAASFRSPPVRGVGVTDDDWRELVRLYLAAAEPPFDREANADEWVTTTLAWARKKESRYEKSGRQVW